MHGGSTGASVRIGFPIVIHEPVSAPRPITADPPAVKLAYYVDAGGNPSACAPLPDSRAQPKPLVDAALSGARIRLRPILMTSFAFILGSTPLWFASGAGAVSRRILGTVVIGGMLAATCIAVCLIPVTFYVIERLATRAKKTVPEIGPAPGAAPLSEP